MEKFSNWLKESQPQYFIGRNTNPVIGMSTQADPNLTGSTAPSNQQLQQTNPQQQNSQQQQQEPLKNPQHLQQLQQYATYLQKTYHDLSQTLMNIKNLKVLSPTLTDALEQKIYKALDGVGQSHAIIQNYNPNFRIS